MKRGAILFPVTVVRHLLLSYDGSIIIAGKEWRMTTTAFLRDLAINGTCPLCDKPAHVQASERRMEVDIVWCHRCGYYEITSDALFGFEQQRHLIAGLTKRASTPEPRVASRLYLTRDSVPSLLATSGVPKDLIDQMDLTLEYAKDHQQRSDNHKEYVELAETDYPLVFARDGD